MGHRNEADNALKRLGWVLGLTRLGLIAEQVTQAFWPLWSLVFTVLAGLMLGAALTLPALLEFLLARISAFATTPVSVWFWADMRAQLPGLSLALMALLLALAANDAIASYFFGVVPLFVLMGEILFRSGSTAVLFDAVDSLIGRVRGRQYVLAMSLATIFGALSGSNMAVAAMMGRAVYPVMAARGYDSKLSIGVILAGSSLAPIIPPSVLAIIIAFFSGMWPYIKFYAWYQH